MAKITKRLSTKKDKVTGKSEVLLRFIGGDKIMLRAKSGIFVKPEWWNEKKQELRTATINTELVEVRRILAELDSLILTRFAEEPEGKLNVKGKWLQNIINSYHNPDNSVDNNDTTTLLKAVSLFIDRLDSRQTSEGKLLSPKSLPQYRIAERHLKEFAVNQKKKDFMLEEINSIFYQKYVAFLQKQGKTTNSIGREIKCLKVIIHQLPHTLQAKCDISKFKVVSEEVDNTYLNEDDLLQLKNCDLSSKPYLEHARDWFLILAWTGCRISDMPKISQADTEAQVITYRQQKTNAKVTIPLHPVVIEILEKYHYQMPEPISDQRFNDYIKEAAKLSGLTKKEGVTRTEGGVTRTEYKEQWELITSHTGRRSFATNAYKRGIPTITIMAITGHKTEKAFLKYIKIKQEEHARIMAEQWEKIYK